MDKQKCRAKVKETLKNIYIFIRTDDIEREKAMQV